MSHQFVPELTNDEELVMHMLEQRAAYMELAKQATKVANKAKARATYNQKYANDPEFREREKERMLSKYYLKKNEKKAAAPTAQIKEQ